jgi:DNA sulfur modification protein DndD
MTKLQILGWESNGLRCIDTKIDLDSSGSLKQVSLLQMPNGTGKTTTLNLMRAALSGSPLREKWDANQIKRLCRPEEKYLSPNHNGCFKLRIKYEDRHGQQELTYVLDFDWEDNSLDFSTIHKGLGKEPGHQIPSAISRLTSGSFVDFFIFDGELAEALFDPDQTKADEAVAALFQLNAFQVLSEGSNEYFKSQRGDLTRAATSQATSRSENKMSKLESRIEKVKKLHDDLDSKVTSLKKQILKLDRNFESELRADKENSEKLTAANAEIKAANKKIESIKERLLLSMRKPHAMSIIFGEQLLELKDSLDKAKLPETACKEFFSDIAQEEECICGREHTDATKRAVVDRMDLYLASDEVSEINAIKLLISNEIGDNVSSPPENLKKIILELREELKDVANIKASTEELKIRAADQDPKLKKIKEEKEALEGKHIQALRDLNRMMDDTSTDLKSLNHKILSAELEKEREKYSQMTDQVELKDKIDKLKVVLDKTFKYANNNLAKGLIEGANNIITNIMPDNKLRLESVTKGALNLSGKEKGSMGETLALSYAFLLTLFDRAADHLPFVVDSPAGPLDNDARREFGNAVPNLGTQFIGFTTSGEREGFIFGLTQGGVKAKVPLHYSTHFRRNSKHWHESLSKNNEVKVTDDGVIVYGKEFFMNFQDDENTNETQQNADDLEMASEA